MKRLNKFIYIFIILLTVLPAYSAEHISIRQTAIKFLYAMGGVVLSSVVIFAGLSLYNKYFTGRSGLKFNKEDSLSTPQTVEDAISFFIKKNKLR